MTTLQSAIDFYHDLAHSGALAQDTWDVLAPGMRERQLYFGDRPLCTVLRPLFHTEEDYRYLTQRTELVLGVFRKASEAMMRDERRRAQVFLTPEEEYLVSLPTGYRTNIPTARLDSFFTRAPDRRVLNFIEFNGESPASMGYSDVLAALFLETPLMRRFQERYSARMVEARPFAADALLRIYAEWKGNRTDRPKMAIVDWAGVPTAPEFSILKEYFARYAGFSSVICTPDDLDFVRGKMYAAGEPVDFVYKRVLTTELLSRYGLDHPIVEALRAQAICLANPFTCKLLHKKASFAFVSDERNADLFSEAEREAVRQHIPWTRILAERKTFDSRGREIDLMPWASRNRESLVLKPNDEYGGKGVLIGWETEPVDWDRALEAALDEPCIVQERALIAYEDFPRLDERGQVALARLLVDCDPFLFHGDTMGGSLVRLSSVTLLNVTAGGGSVVPLFVIDDK